jgi:hypothetical protein
LEQEFFALGCHPSASGSPFLLRHVGGSVPIAQTSCEPKGNALLYLLDVFGGFGWLRGWTYWLRDRFGIGRFGGKAKDQNANNATHEVMSIG